jgi:hypothetical protein
LRPIKGLIVKLQENKNQSWLGKGKTPNQYRLQKQHRWEKSCVLGRDEVILMCSNQKK